MYYNYVLVIDLYVPYSGKLSTEQIGRKGAFCGENVCRILNRSHNGCDMPTVSWRNLSWVVDKSQIL